MQGMPAPADSHADGQVEGANVTLEGATSPKHRQPSLECAFNHQCAHISPLGRCHKCCHSCSCIMRKKHMFYSRRIESCSAAGKVI